jgi:hypothetical protein
LKGEEIVEVADAPVNAIYARNCPEFSYRIADNGANLTTSSAPRLHGGSCMFYSPSLHRTNLIASSTELR